MDIREALVRRKAEVEQRYNDLSQNVANDNDEMKRLEGEFRLLSALLNDFPPVVEDKPTRIRKAKVQEDAADKSE